MSDKEKKELYVNVGEKDVEIALLENSVLVELHKEKIENHLFKSRPKDAPGVEFFPWETVKDMYTTDEGFYSIRD